MKIFLLIFVFIITISISFGQESSPSYVKEDNFEIISLLNGIRFIDNIKHKDFVLKIYQYDDLPGSAGFTTGEVNTFLYLAISEYDELPEQKLFKINSILKPTAKSVQRLEEYIILTVKYGKIDDQDESKYFYQSSKKKIRKLLKLKPNQPLNTDSVFLCSI